MTKCLNHFIGWAVVLRFPLSGGVVMNRLTDWSGFRRWFAEACEVLWSTKPRGQNALYPGAKAQIVEAFDPKNPGLIVVSVSGENTHGVSMIGAGGSAGSNTDAPRFHEWQPSILGHGSLFCPNCKATDLEAAALGWQFCPGPQLSGFWNLRKV